MPAAKFEIVRKCKICGEPFKAKTIESWYCSPRCSKIAWKRNKDEELRMQKLDEVVKKIPKSKDYITVPEAYALFGISKETLYRLIRKGVISSVNVGERQTRVSWKSHATLTLLAKQDLPTFGYNMIAPLKSWCWGSILFYPFKISRFS